MDKTNSSYADLQIGEFKDFLQYGDLFFVEMTESSGLCPTSFKVCFRTKDEKIADKIIVNNPVKVKIGQSENDYEVFETDISEIIDKKNNQTVSEWLITFVSTIKGGCSFCTDRKNYCKTGTAIDVLKETFNEANMAINADIFNSSGKDFYKFVNVHDIKSYEAETTKWRRNSKTLNVYLSDVWLHMNIMPSFPLMAMDKHNNVYLKSFDKLIKEETVYTFTPDSQNAKNDQIVYHNVFKTDSFKVMSNLFSGFGQVTTINNSSSGTNDIYVNNNKPLVAATQEDETANYGVSKMDSETQSKNVHRFYKYAYIYNTTKLVNLSSILGHLDCIGYYPNVKPLDLIKVIGASDDDNGKYIIDTIVTTFIYNKAPQTSFYVVRDNYNYIENNIVKKPKILSVSKAILRKVLSGISNLRRCLAFAGRVLDGSLVRSFHTYFSGLKYSILSSFVVQGNIINLNSSVGAINSFLGVGNTLLNQFVDAIIPYPYNSAFHNLFFRGNDTWRTTFGRLLNEFVPVELRSICMDIVNYMTGISDGLKITLIDNTLKIKQDNVSLGEYQYVSSVIGDTNDGLKSITTSKEGIMQTENNSTRVQDIVTAFLSNTDGVDLPMPNIALDESTQLLSDADLKEYIADKTIEGLVEDGYLANVDPEVVKEILMIDYIPEGSNIEQEREKIAEAHGTSYYEIVKNINDVAGYLMYLRYWGVLNSEDDITDYYLVTCYSDMFRTPATTKIIKTSRGQKVFISMPVILPYHNLEFYVNDEKYPLEEDKEPTDTKYIKVATIKTTNNLYDMRVFYTSDGFNNNGTVFEIREKKRLM